MARYEFKFVISDVELSDEHRERVGEAIAQAGALAVADLTPAGAISIRFAPGWWWRGYPPIEILRPVQEYAEGQADEGPGEIES